MNSITSGAAMDNYLDRITIYTIILVGWWSRDALLGYIQKQVEQFNHNVSTRMICHQKLTHIPIFWPQISWHDPHQRNRINNVATKINMGGVTPIRTQLAMMEFWM